MSFKSVSLLFISMLLLTFSCLDASSNENSALINIYLIDAPGDFDQAWIDIERVEVFIQGGNSAGTKDWIPLDYVPTSNVINVTSLVNGNQLILGRSELPLGKISQIKLVLGEDHYLVKDGEQLALTLLDSESQEPIIDVDYSLSGAMSYDILLDMDLSKSIIADPAQENVFWLDPVMRSFETGAVASISGKVTPIEAKPIVYAIIGEDSISTHTDDTGAFLFNGLQAGEYSIYISPRAPYLDSLTTVTTKIDSLSAMETILLSTPDED
ncbi:DUF4382 domain-containing protein [Echinicola sp. 20G]|uniref:DUF4382 domain-containing protein n=1 Tax=Echinicola sp. 20G TaxID=2781961 RepID=UPI001910D196|nr:DUF4382 domain-containing protein [Echinicola sp. 20G]